MDDIETDVLIIGAGIAGSALACALRGCGLRVLAIDKSDGPLDTARGDHLQPMSCEILDRWGVLQDLFDAGAEKRLGAIWRTPDGDEILRSSVAELDIPHPYFAFVNHELIAETLMNAALQSEDVRVIRPIRNWWLTESDDKRYGIRIGLPGSDDVNVRASLIVGADGRVSRTRSQFGFDSTAHQYDCGITVFFAHQEEENPGSLLHVYLGDVITSVIPRTGGACKIGFPIAASTAARWRRRDAADSRAILKTMVPALAIGKPEFGDIYAPVYLQVADWVRDGVALIGDACHAMHPARSQGMNISLRCIDVLAELLTMNNSRLDRAGVTATLLEYQRRMKTPICAVLRKNHELALEMDAPTASQSGRLEERLRRIQADPKALHDYSLAASGYQS